MKLYVSLCLCIAIAFSSCIIERPTYYVSPLNGNNTLYHAMLLQKDSISKATYASASLYLGNANTNQTDKVFNFQGSVYQARQFGIFEAYYGADAFAGNYKVTAFDTATYNSSIDWKALNAMAGNKLYTGIGLAGGMNIVHTTRHGEWRIIGAELASHQDFGAYYDFRKKLPANAANLIVRSGNFTTIGLNTETVRKTKQGAYSLKFAYGFVLGRSYNNVQALNFTTQIVEPIRYNYATLTFQYTYQRWTGYIQNGGGSYAMGYQFGAIYRLH